MLFVTLALSKYAMQQEKVTSTRGGYRGGGSRGSGPPPFFYKNITSVARLDSARSQVKARRLYALGRKLYRRRVSVRGIIEMAWTYIVETRKTLRPDGSGVHTHINNSAHA